MHSRSIALAILAAAATTLPSTPHLHAQQAARRAAPEQRGAAANSSRVPQGRDANAPTTPTGEWISVREIFLPSDEVKAAEASLPVSDKKESVWEKATAGGKRKRDASRIVLQRMAHAQVAGSGTVVVVIGSDKDRTKVIDGLAEVQRRVMVLYVDADAKSPTYDNTGLKGSLLGLTKRPSGNVWVYLPGAAGSTDTAPSNELLSQVMLKPLLTTIFAKDGDVPNLSRGRDREGAAAPLAATNLQPGPAPSQVPGGLAVDSIVVARIAGVKIQESPSEGARVLATVGKGDELIVTAGDTGGYVKVQGAAAEGWVKATMVAKAK